MYNRGTGLALVVRTRAFTAEGWGSVPGGRNKVPQGVWCRQKQKRANWLCNRMAEWVGEWSVCCIKESNASEGNSAGLLFPDYSDIKAPHFFFLVFSLLLLVSFLSYLLWNSYMHILQMQLYKIYYYFDWKLSSQLENFGVCLCFFNFIEV